MEMVFMDVGGFLSAYCVRDEEYSKHCNMLQLCLLQEQNAGFII